MGRMKNPALRLDPHRPRDIRGYPGIFKKNKEHPPLSTSFIHFLDELEDYKSFFIFEKIENSFLKNQADGQKRVSRLFC